jgi:hypothetical protein
MSPSEFEFLTNLIWEKKKIWKKGHCWGKPFLFKKGWHWRYVLIHSVALSWVHSILQLPKRSRNRTALQIYTNPQDRSNMNMKMGRGVNGVDESCCTSITFQSVTVSSLWCDGQILTADWTSPWCYRVTNFWYITWLWVLSTLL